jgi:putative transcriptional regulator
LPGTLVLLWHYGEMQTWLAGQLLVAAPLLRDPNFYRTVVLILRHAEDGAMGVVLNRPSAERAARYLPEWEEKLEPEATVFVGGPVQPEVAIGFSRPAELSLPDTGLVDLSAGSDLHQNGPIRVFAGYAGWGPGQLEAELEEEAWMVLPPDWGDLFSDEPEKLWSRVLARQGGRLGMLAHFPPDPSLN